MAEYIEREAALKCICSGCFEGDMNGNGFCGIPCDDYKRISDLPAADVRPVVRGKWEYNPGDNIPYCSECMMPQDSECNFCPNCGADMRQCPEDEADEEIASVRWWLRMEKS